MLDIPSPVTVSLHTAVIVSREANKISLYLKAGETIELVCSYDLEDDRLYSVKWQVEDYT